jgi:DNA-binding CsgD family transcriptional regulator
MSLIEIRTHARVKTVERQDMSTRIAVHRSAPKSRVTTSFNPSLAILEKMGCGGFLVSVDGMILAANGPAARALQAICPGFSKGDQQRRLPLTLRAFIDPDKQGPEFLNCGGERPFLLQRIALKRHDGMILLLIADLNTSQGPSADILQQGFGLTPCEARVAAALAKGLSLNEIAKQHSVGVGTVRGQLKSVFIKTGTRRQGELVAMLARLVGFSRNETTAPIEDAISGHKHEWSKTYVTKAC